MRSELLGLAAILALALTACGTGSVPTGDDDGMGGGADAGTGDRLCQAELSVSGTFTQVADPPEGDGCVPNGTWELNLQVEDMANCQNVTFEEGGYSYEVTGDPNLGEEWDVTYLDDPDNPTVFLDVKGQGGACEGSFEHWSTDGTTLLLIRPYQEGTTISGSAYFEEYSEGQLGN